MTLSRNVPLDPKQSALLFIDVQNFSAHRDGAEFKDLTEDAFTAKYGWFFDQLDTRIIPNMQALQTAARAAGVEVMYTTIESLTLDGRDRSLDYKITGFNVPKGSWDGKVIDQIAPEGAVRTRWGISPGGAVPRVLYVQPYVLTPSTTMFRIRSSLARTTPK